MISAVVLRGDQGNFCGGADLDWLRYETRQPNSRNRLVCHAQPRSNTPSGDTQPLLRSANRVAAPELYSALADLHLRIATYRKPVVSLASGTVAGGGLGLANTYAHPHAQPPNDHHDYHD